MSVSNSVFLWMRALIGETLISLNVSKSLQEQNIWEVKWSMPKWTKTWGFMYDFSMFIWNSIFCYHILWPCNSPPSTGNVSAKICFVSYMFSAVSWIALSQKKKMQQQNQSSNPCVKVSQSFETNKRWPSLCPGWWVWLE